MENKMVIKNPQAFGETIESLVGAIENSGGRVPLSDLFHMSVLEFLSSVACSNGIRFYHKNSHCLSKNMPLKKKKIDDGEDDDEIIYEGDSLPFITAPNPYKHKLEPKEL